MARSRKAQAGDGTTARPVNLRVLAEHLGLSQAAVSLVLNDAPGARAIPDETKRRIVAAAKELDYRPNPIARSLRSQRSFTIGVLLPDLSDPFSAQILGGIEEYLLQNGYFFFAASHHHDEALIEQYTQLFVRRNVEGLVLVDTPPRRLSSVPVVAVSRHEKVDGVPRILLDHDRAATLAVEHLLALGHRKIAVFKGPRLISDSRERWAWIRRVAARHGLAIARSLVVELEGEAATPEAGYAAARRLLATGEPFTALFAFNDPSAIGAIRTFREAGLRVPEDVSVVGFDDAQGAAFHHPALTTIRQPLARMGRLAAELVLASASRRPAATSASKLTLEPELVVRQSTAPAASSRRAPSRRGS